MENNAAGKPGVLAQTAKLMSDEQLNTIIDELEDDLEDANSTTTSAGIAYNRFSLNVFHAERGERLLNNL